jgi:hypothetical protein
VNRRQIRLPTDNDNCAPIVMKFNCRPLANGWERRGPGSNSSNSPRLCANPAGPGAAQAALRRHCTSAVPQGFATAFQARQRFPSVKWLEGFVP